MKRRLRRLTAMNMKFKWTDCQQSFDRLKELLTNSTVHWDPDKKTKIT